MKLIGRVKKFKKSKKKLVCLTAYSKPIAKILDKYCDINLVGDSVATAFYGMKNTREIKLDTMINHAISVKKACYKSILVFDMPYNTYKNIKNAKKNIKKVIKKKCCDAIKLESNGKNFRIIKNLVDSGISVMGHIGYTPQNKKLFRPHGVKNAEQKKLINEAIKIEKAGAFAIVLECINSNTAKKITQSISIPTIGIGSSKFCDGQVLVTDDLLGLNETKIKFVKKFINIRKNIEQGIKKFKFEVINKKYPSKKYSY